MQHSLFLDPEARKHFKHFVSILDKTEFIEDVDTSMLEMLAEKFCEYQNVKKTVIETNYTDLQLMKYCHTIFKEIVVMMRELGLTPISRTRIQKKIEKQEDEITKLLDL